MEIENEYGNLQVVVPDALEPGWINPVTLVEFDHDRQVVVVSVD